MKLKRSWSLVVKYKVVLTEKAKKQLKKLDKYTSSLIIRLAKKEYRRL